MPRNLFAPGTPVPSQPDPLLLFIQWAQLRIYCRDRHPDQSLAEREDVLGVEREPARW